MKILYLQLGVFAVRCGFWPFLAPHFAVRFSKNHNCTTLYFCGHMCGAVRYGAIQSLVKTITAPYLIFAVTCTILYIRYDLKSVYFSNFGFFLPSPKLIFPFFGPSFKLLSQFFFILGWFFQSILVRVIKLFFGENQGY